jgi:prostaglandin-endoperoxide synthase 2
MRAHVIKLLRWFLASFPRFWRLMSAIPWLRVAVNRLAINLLTNATRARPHPLSLWGPLDPPNPPEFPACADHVSWTGLVDRTYTGRHLCPAEQQYVDGLPKVETLAGLFARNGPMLPCPKSSALFGFFAQWFTDSFLRTHPTDIRKNTSNHEIDLCQIYGLSAEDARVIRGGAPNGELESQRIGSEEYPPYLFEDDGGRVKQKYLGLSYVDQQTADFKRVNDVLPQGFNTPERKRRFFVTGLERGNSTILYSALNTVFLREHNRLCRELRRAHPAWDDERLFDTARNINIVQLVKLIVEDYINHLSPAQFKVFHELGFAEKQKWYRTNRICAEFNLLYRWHQLVPTELKVQGRTLGNQDFRFNNELLVGVGIEAVVRDASRQAAGRISLKNTAPFLVEADLAAIRKSRAWRIQPYTEYVKAFNVEPVGSFSDLTGDEALARELEALYGTVERVEYPIGLLAEQRSKGAMLGDLMTAMVAVDAFSQALTNPLLSQNVYGADSLSPVGLASIKNTSSLADIVARNTGLRRDETSFGLRRVPGSYGLPLIGWLFDTFDIFLFSGCEKFFRRRQRKLGSTVFKINLFQPTIAMLDHRAISSLFASKDLAQEKPSNDFQFQIPPLPLVGNLAPSMFGDGDAHDVPKRVYLRLLRERSATLAATFDATMRDFTARWVKLGRFNFRDELEDFVVTLMFRWILGESPAPKDVRELYSGIFSHWAIAITRYIPGSAFRRSLGIYRRLLEFVRTAPTFDEIAALAAAEGMQDRDALAKHLTFVLGMNSFLGNQSVLKSLIGELTNSPELRAALREEIGTALGARGAASDMRTLSALPLLDRTLREILRLHPPVFFIYGRATRDRVIESVSGEFAIAKGDLVLGVIPMAHLDQAVFGEDASEFNPQRFARPELSRYLIWPRGAHDDPSTAENRACAGKDVALFIAKLFCAELLLNYDWELKTRPAWGQRFALNIAAPKGPLRVTRFMRRRRDVPGVTAETRISPRADRAAA